MVLITFQPYSTPASGETAQFPGEASGPWLTWQPGQAPPWGCRVDGLCPSERHEGEVVQRAWVLAPWLRAPVQTPTKVRPVLQAFVCTMGLPRESLWDAVRWFLERVQGSTSPLPLLLLFKNFFTYLFNFVCVCFGCAGFLLLLGLFSSCSKQALLPSCGAWASQCSGFSCFGAWAPGCSGFSSCSSRALEHRHSSCGPQA